MSGKVKDELPMVPAAMAFGGGTYDPLRDYSRLKLQLINVWKIMRDTQWHYLEELSRRAGGSEASVSARVRDFRKEKYGSWEVLREYVGDGLWKYRVTGRQFK